MSASDYYFKPNVNGIKLYYSKLTKKRIAKSKIPAEILDDIEYCENYVDTKEIIKKREKKEKEDFERDYERDEEHHNLLISYDKPDKEKLWEEHIKFAHQCFRMTRAKNQKQYQKWLLNNPRHSCMFYIKLAAEEKGWDS